MTTKQIPKKIEAKKLPKIDDEYFDSKQLKFSFDLSRCKFELDVLQNKMLESYLRLDLKFRKAFSINYNSEFFQYIRDKARLREPISLSVMGNTRTFTNNNFIFTNKGWRNPNNMEDCKKVLSWNFDLEKFEYKNFQLIKRKRDLKEKFYKIIFSDNRIIEIGEKHPIFTKNKGWKKAFSLYPDIEIPFFNDYPNQISKDEISIEFARILAFIYSCGHLNGSEFKCLDKRDGKYYNKKQATISYCNSQSEMVKLFCKDFLKEFGLKMTYKKKRNNHYQGIEVEKYNKRVFDILSAFIPVGKKSGIIEIPDCIFNASRDIQREFIATLFSGDGYISDMKKGMAIVEYYTMSNEFAKQLQLILMQYGIISYILKKKVKNGKFINRVTITNLDNISNFKRFVKKLPSNKKNQRLNYIVKTFKKTTKNLISKNFSIRKIEQFKCSDDFIYDIFVDDNNNFFLNGILTHNSGKSYSSIGLCGYHQACFNKKFSIDYICANKMEFLQKIKDMPEEKTTNRIYLIDEEKNLFGTGSLAKKIRFDDVMSIIAKRNLSTINLTPYSFVNSDSNYGIRIFGRDFNQKICRAMLYNLQEKGHGGSMPMGCLYLPIFTTLFPKDYAEPLEKAYIKKKDNWILNEQRSEGDVLYDLKRKTAENFLRNKEFNQLIKKKERTMFIAQKLGSSWTKNEIEEIETLTKMLSNGIKFDES